MNVRGGWIHELALTLAALFFAFVNVTLLVPVLPVLAEHAGGAAGAGAVTAIFYLPTAGMQILTPILMQHASPRLLLAVSLCALGAPCLLSAAMPENLGVLLATTAVRGAGFGVATVVTGTLVVQIAPPERRGTAVGSAGLVFGIPPVFAPALGLYLFHTAGAGRVLAIAGAIGLVGCLGALVLGDHPRAEQARPGVLLRAMVDPLLIWPLVWFGMVSMARGAVVSFVPLTLASGGLASAAAFLLFFGTFAFLSRWACGRIADRIEVRRLIAPGGAAAIAGLILLPASQAGAAIALSGALFGVGSGALMTVSQLDMLRRGSRTGFAVPIAVWNIAIDCGFGLGGVLLSGLVLIFGYHHAFWALPVLVGAALVIAAAEPDPPAETDKSAGDIVAPQMSYIRSRP